MRMRLTHWFGLGVVLTSLTWADMAKGYPRYYDAGSGGCRQCHGRFTSPDSPRGTVFPENNKHTMHSGMEYMDTFCFLCHSIGDGGNPYIGSSDGVPGITGVGCNGCHARDYGGSIGVSGVGLRAHHTLNGVSGCLACHTDDPPPLPENVAPPYYGTTETRANDPCNAAPTYRENWSVGDTLGLDNDGNGLFDEADPHCLGPGNVPAVSEWGLIILALLLLAGAKIHWAAGPR